MKLWTTMAAVVGLMLLVGTGAQAGDKGKELKLVDGKLTQAVPLTKDDPAIDGKPAKVFLIRLEAGKTYQIDLKGSNADDDPYLLLQDGTGKKLTEDDDGGANLDALITFRCETAGVYRIVCTCFDLDTIGTYSLHVQQK